VSVGFHLHLMAEPPEAKCWRDRFGSLDSSLGPDRRLTVAAVNVRYLAPVRFDDELRIEVSFDRITERSIHVRYDAFVGDALVAEAGSDTPVSMLSPGSRPRFLTHLWADDRTSLSETQRT
jgi:acyl-CoA thioesterase FadM